MFYSNSNEMSFCLFYCSLLKCYCFKASHISSNNLCHMLKPLKEAISNYNILHAQQGNS